MEIKNQDDYFRKECVSGDKKVHYYCNACGGTMTANRRDLNAILISFLFALEMLINETGKLYHDYSDVIAKCRKEFSTKPNDYSYLENQWFFISIDPEIKGEHKMKTITEAGFRFLHENLMIAEYCYILPISGTVLYSKSKTNCKKIIDAWVEKKKGNNPFYRKGDKS